jgi:lipopolysaccharide/colanic/teichoic acid biosynthesis glycosyltransferase
VRGDLSIVGPRPEEVAFAEEFGNTVRGYRARHRVPAGITGLAQVNGLRGDTSIEDRARLDNLYIDNWSFWGDIVIIARTVRAVLFARHELKFDPDHLETPEYAEPRS